MFRSPNASHIGEQRLREYSALPSKNRRLFAFQLLSIFRFLSLEGRFCAAAMAKFVPRDRKKRRRKADNTQDGGILDTNVVEVIPPVASEREKKKREIKNSIRAQQPAMSSKKAKRLDKYIVRR